MTSLSLDLTWIFLFAFSCWMSWFLCWELVFRNLRTVLLLIWLMCFLTNAFGASLSRHCGQGSGPHLFLIYTDFTREKCLVWLKIKCGRTTPVEIMISASELWTNGFIIKPVQRKAILHLLDVFLVLFNSPWCCFLVQCLFTILEPVHELQSWSNSCSWIVKNHRWSLTLSWRWSTGHVSRNLWKGLPWTALMK